MTCSSTSISCLRRSIPGLSPMRRAGAYQVPALAQPMDNRGMWSRVWQWLRTFSDAITYPSYGAFAGDLISAERAAQARALDRKQAECPGPQPAGGGLPHSR